MIKIRLSEKGINCLLLLPTHPPNSEDFSSGNRAAGIHLLPFLFPVFSFVTQALQRRETNTEKAKGPGKKDEVYQLSFSKLGASPSPFLPRQLDQNCVYIFSCISRELKLRFVDGA